MLKLKVYSLPSCIASNDFVLYCKQKNLDFKNYVVKDINWPQIRHDVTLEEVESLYKRNFFSLPIIYINEEYINSIQTAKKLIEGILKNE